MDASQYDIKQGFVPNIHAEGTFYMNEELKPLVTAEPERSADVSNCGGGGSILAVKEIANVSLLSGIIGRSIGIPDVHSGYGFAIGNVAEFDMADLQAIISSSGVGFDINSGVRFICTNLTEANTAPEKEQLEQTFLDHINV